MPILRIKVITLRRPTPAKPERSRVITHHAAACIRTLQMNPIHNSHQREIRFRHGHRLVICRRSGHAKNLGLFAHWQFVTRVNQRFALNNPALVSALSKKSVLRNSVSNCYQSRLIQPRTAGLLIFHGLHDVFHPSHHRK